MIQPGDGQPGGASMAAPYIDDVQAAMNNSAHLRVALNMLEDIPLEWQTDSVDEVLTGLREKLQELEIQQILSVGPIEYLLIKPLAPDAGRAFAEQVAGHVQALYELGLIVRLDLP